MASSFPLRRHATRARLDLQGALEEGQQCCHDPGGMERLLPLPGFAVAASVTPGPKVLMVAAAAANRGVRATLPHMLGITFGFALMPLIVGLGLAGPFAASPVLHRVLRWRGGALDRPPPS